MRTTRNDQGDFRGRHHQIRLGAGDDQEWRQGLVGGSDPRRERIVEARSQRTRTSRLLHRLGEATSHAWAGLVIGSAVCGWLALGFVVGFPSWWQATLYSVSSALTLTMVFALQHTQTRQQSATQRKLDELLRTQPSADGSLMALEEAPDQELETLADMNLEDRERAAQAAKDA